MIVAIYSRKSKFTGTGDSIENQVQICKDYFYRDEHKDIEFKVYEDEGFSGKNTNRPMFQMMMSDIKQRKIDTVICYRLDRLSRNVSNFSDLLETLQRYKVDFISVKESFDTSTPIGRAMIYIASVFSQLERETIAERVRDNKLEIAKSGRWQGGVPPFGYRAERETMLDENGKNRSAYFLMRDDNSAELAFATKVFEMYRKFGTTSGVQRYFMSHKEYTPNGKEPDLTVIKQLLSNPVYVCNDTTAYDFLSRNGCMMADDRDAYTGEYGLMGYGKTSEVSPSKRTRAGMSNWIIAIGKHKAIISGKEWVHIIESLRINADKAPRMHTSDVALFSGMITCQCGAKMIVKNNRLDKNGEPIFYYKCIRKDKSRGELCNSKNVNGVRFDRETIEKIKDLLSDTGELKKDVQYSLHYIKASEKTIDVQIIDMKKEISDKEKQIQNLILQLAKPNISKTLLKQIDGLVTKLSEETDICKDRLRLLCEKRQGADIDKINLDILQKSVMDFKNNYDIATLEEKRNLISNIVKEIRYKNGAFEIGLYTDRIVPG